MARPREAEEPPKARSGDVGVDLEKDISDTAESGPARFLIVRAESIVFYLHLLHRDGWHGRSALRVKAKMAGAEAEAEAEGRKRIKRASK